MTFGMALAKRARFSRGPTRLRRYRSLKNLPPLHPGSTLASSPSGSTTPDRVFRIARRCDVTGQTRLMSFGQLGDLAVECGQVKTELPETLRGPHALFGAFDLVGECADGARQALPDLGYRGPRAVARQ
jgi:hypothetical protein